MNYHEAWANGEIEAGTLVDAIEELTAELADLKANRDALMLVHRVGRALDQQRTETAADNCEVLRARLARYEDGDGKPITTIAEQAREIERLQLTCNDIDDQNDRIYAEIAALKAQHEQDAQTIKVLQAMARQLKAKPSVVVQWPEADEIMQMAFEEGQPSEAASGYYFELEEFDLFIQRLMEEVARLNSSPVSANQCGDCGYPITTGPHCISHNKQAFRAGGVDEREAIHQLAFEIGGTEGGEYWLDAEDLDKVIDAAWQARAALSAPGHGEQVPDGWNVAGDILEKLSAAQFEIDQLKPDAMRFRFLDRYWTRAVSISGYPSQEIDREYIDRRMARHTDWQARAALSAPGHGEQVRHMVPAWMASARTFVDRLHLAGWRDHADAQHAGVAGMYDELLAAAPSAGSQKERGHD